MCSIAFSVATGKTGAMEAARRAPEHFVRFGSIGGGDYECDRGKSLGLEREDGWWVVPPIPSGAR